MLFSTYMTGEHPITGFQNHFEGIVLLTCVGRCKTAVCDFLKMAHHVSNAIFIQCYHGSHSNAGYQVKYIGS